MDTKELPNGSITVYKKLYDGAVATLLIPAGTPRTHTLTSNKCRAKAAIVLSIADRMGRSIECEGSIYAPGVLYRVGKTVEAWPEYNGDPKIECAPGIHFFITAEEVKEYRG